jgi:hypothetical protein
MMMYNRSLERISRARNECQAFVTRLDVAEHEQKAGRRSRTLNAQFGNYTWHEVTNTSELINHYIQTIQTRFNFEDVLLSC